MTNQTEKIIKLEQEIENLKMNLSVMESDLKFLEKMQDNQSDYFVEFGMLYLAFLFGIVITKLIFG